MGACAACAGPPTGAGLPLPTDPRTAGHLAELDGVLIDRFDRDQIHYRARVERVHFDRQGGVATGEGVAVDVLEKDDPKSTKVHVTAPRGKSVLRSRVVTLEGGVVMHDRDGRTMKTEAATYDAPADHLDAPGDVTLEGDNFRAQGASLTGKPMAGTLEVGGPARAHVDPKKRE
jgi:hypothetical protein